MVRTLPSGGRGCWFDSNRIRSASLGDDMIIWLVSLVFLLAGCSQRTYTPQVITQKIEQRITKEVKRPDAHVAVLFDLGQVSSSSYLYYPSYQSIINNYDQAQQFLTKHIDSFKDYNKLNKVAGMKIAKARVKLDALRAKNLIPQTYKSFLVGKDNIEKLHSLHAKFLRHIPLMLPMSNPKLTSGYGPRGSKTIYIKHGRKKIKKKQRCFHYAVDLIGPINAPVFASAEGMAETGISPSYGRYVVIHHDYGIKTLYAHLSSVMVKTQERVLQGQILGLQGDSGRARGHHLHFEIIINARKIDPMIFIADEYATSKN